MSDSVAHPDLHSVATTSQVLRVVLPSVACCWLLAKRDALDAPGTASARSLIIWYAATRWCRTRSSSSGLHLDSTTARVRDSDADRMSAGFVKAKRLAIDEHVAHAKYGRLCGRCG